MKRRDILKLLATIPLITGADWVKTSLGIYLPSEKEHVIKAIQKYSKGKTFLDLGSGDGRVILWAKDSGAKARGIEKESFATDIKGDFFDYDLNKYEVLYYYIQGCDKQTELFQKIRDSFKGTVLVNKNLAELNSIDLILGDVFETIDKVNVFKFT